MSPNTTKTKTVLTLLAGVYFLLSANSVEAAIYTVTNTNNTGAGSLRQAITDANANTGLDTVRFNIATGGGNLFESSGGNSWAVIVLSTTLPTITSPVLIDGYSQTNTNTGNMAGRTVGADAIVQPNIPYPDVYIVPASGYSFPSGASGASGNCFTINISGVTIRGIAISGWGNTNADSGTASGHAEVQIVRSLTERDIAFNIYDCFLSSDPRGAYPTLSYRRSKGNSILIAANNINGRIASNYMAFSGTYAIHFNGLTDILSVGAGTVLGNRNWVIENNQLIDLGYNAGITNSTRVADAINTMKCTRFLIRNNYIYNVEQVGIDLGYNADNNYVSNNTITGLTRATTIALPQVAIRIGLCSQYDTLIKNVIHSNSGTNFRGGIWIDRSRVNTTGITNKANAFNHIQENIIYNNGGSAIVLSNYIVNSGGVNNANVITRNSTYNNTGLGIDLGFGTANSTMQPVSSTAVTVNDNGDSDTGPNDLQNFPYIDSARITGSGIVTIWGKSPPGATIEFFGGDGEINSHGGRVMSYGEGRYYIGTGIEGAIDDGASGTNYSYSFDGNVAINNLNLFRFSFAFGSGVGSLDSLTSTATISNNTSEFGPVAIPDIVLGCTLFDISLLYADNKSILKWSAICDTKFSQFIIERSNDGKNFSQLGTANAPAINEPIQLDFTDNFPATGNSYYRLKMLNTDGTYKYSKILRLHTSTGVSIKVLPNPFTSEINIVQQLDRDGSVDIRIVDISGRIWASRSLKGYKGINNFSVQGIDHLAKGLYILEIHSNGKLTREKITKN